MASIKIQRGRKRITQHNAAIKRLRKQGLGALAITQELEREGIIMGRTTVLKRLKDTVDPSLRSEGYIIEY